MTTQREFMKKLYRQFNGADETIITAYANAEKNKIVSRRRNSHNLSPATYARALYNDGIRKGWLR